MKRVIILVVSIFLLVAPRALPKAWNLNFHSHCSEGQ